MKTNKFYSTLASISIVLLLSFASFANTNTIYAGDVTKASKNVTSVAGSESESVDNNDYSYLRFDVNDYITNSDIEDITNYSYDYLRFDVNDYTSAIETEISELPVMNEFDYLRFDVNDFTTDESGENFELPVNEYNYLRFDVNSYMNAGSSAINELPEIE